MTTCPNGDPNFNLVLQKLVGNSKPETRKAVFYGVCIPVRLILYGLVLYFHNYPAIPYIVGLLAAVAIMNLLPSFWTTGQQQWWSKRFQAIMSILIALTCLLVILNKVGSIYIPVFLFISLGSGVLQSFINPIC